MKTLGQVIRNARERRSWSIAQLAEKTSVSATYLALLENEAYAQLPAPALVRGYLKLIALTLEIPEETVQALYRRDTHSQLTPTLTSAQTRKRHPWQFAHWSNPRAISIGLVSMLILFSGSVLGWYWWNLDQPPMLKVSQPTQGQVLTSPLNITGQTDPTASVTINTRPVTLDTEGRFSHELALPPGERALVITARNSRGLQTESILFIEIDPPTVSQ